MLRSTLELCLAIVDCESLVNCFQAKAGLLETVLRVEIFLTMDFTSPSLEAVVSVTFGSRIEGRTVVRRLGRMIEIPLLGDDVNTGDPLFNEPEGIVFRGIVPNSGGVWAC